MVSFGVMFGRLVRERRGIEGLSQDGLAEKTGLAKARISDIETASPICCGTSLEIAGARVRVAPNLYPKLLARMRPHFGAATMRFLASRGDRSLRQMYFDSDAEMSATVDLIDSDLSYDPAANLLSKLTRDGLLPESVREAAADKVGDLTITMVDAAVFHDDDIRRLLTDDEFREVSVRFETDVANRIDDVAQEKEDSIVFGDKAAYLDGLKDNLEYFARYKEATEGGVSSNLLTGIRRIKERVEEIRFEDTEPDRPNIASAPTATKLDPIAAIFEDVDD